MRISNAARRSLLGAALALLVVPAIASAHAEISPKVSLSGKLQLYSLAVPTEKAGLTTSKIVMTVPRGSGSIRSLRRRRAGRSPSLSLVRATAR